MGGTPPPLTENQCEKRRIFSLVERGGTTPPKRAKSAKTFLTVSLKVYEEEVLGSTVPLWWSSNGTKIAFASFDDTAVKPITLTRYNEQQFYNGEPLGQF